MLKVFIGFDPRQPVSYNVLQQSIFTRSSKAVSITPLVIEQLPITRVGLTPFTYSRFLVPYLCNYEGWALFLDIDMLVKGDIAELFDYRDEQYAVMVSKNDKKFEWASAMLFNCKKCRVLTPGFIQNPPNDENGKSIGLHTIEWVKPEEIGDLPREWNHLVGYDKPRHDAKLIHYTQGVPCFKETITSEHAQTWHDDHRYLNYAKPWEELMGNSVHATVLNGYKVPKFVAEQAQQYQVAANGN